MRFSLVKYRSFEAVVGELQARDDKSKGEISRIENVRFEINVIN